MGTDAGARANAAQRAAETMLRTLGGATIQVRVPVLAVNGDAGQLGASAALFEDVAICPAEGQRRSSHQRNQQKRFTCQGRHFFRYSWSTSNHAMAVRLTSWAFRWEMY